MFTKIFAFITIGVLLSAATCENQRVREVDSNSSYESQEDSSSSSSDSYSPAEEPLQPEDSQGNDYNEDYGGESE